MNNSNLVCAVRGPILLITLGALLVMDHLGPVGFGRTWPVLIIVFGVLKLLERSAAGAPTAPPPAAPGGIAS